VAQGGPPEAEYALFDAGEIELHATDPGTIREIGYRTTVGEARARLAGAGITPALAAEAASAARPVVTRAYARGAAVRSVVDRLEPAEVLESRVFDAGLGLYLGTWLDLGALGSDLGMPRASTLLQAAHLAALLAEHAEDAPLVLTTSELTAQRRPGERTFRRCGLGDAPALVEALRKLRPGRPRRGGDVGPSRPEIRAWLQAQAERAPAGTPARERLAAMEAALSAREPPSRGPLAETVLWTLEAKLARGETTGVLEQLDAIEKRRGRVPGTTYLRARLALMKGTEPARAIAERVSALSTSMTSFDELQLLAAQAWSAAGDARRARAFARDVLENASADDALRMHAMELLDAAGESSSSNVVAAAAANPQPAPPSTHHAKEQAVEPRRIVTVQPPATSSAPTPRSPEVAPTDDVAIPRAPRAPSGTEMDPPVSSPATATPRSVTRSSFPAPPRTATRSLPPGTSQPPFRLEARGQWKWSSPPPAPHEVPVERVEGLSLPPGMEGAFPPTDERPRDPRAARLAFTYLARELARELRVRHGYDLRCDVEGLERAQRYLREALADGRVRNPEEEREVMRHGAFVSELLARRLGARWVDLESDDPGHWAMLVPSRTRTEPTDQVVWIWPFARVLRFVAMAHKERDLVSYYLELEGRSR
jgi:hypothetical protein